MRPPIHPLQQHVTNLQYEVDQLHRVLDLIFWVFMAQLVIILALFIYIVAVYKRERQERGDYFAGYHKAMHEEMEKQNAPTVPKRTLQAKPPPKQPVEEPTTVEQPVAVGVGRHRSGS